MCFKKNMATLQVFLQLFQSPIFVCPYDAQLLLGLSYCLCYKYHLGVSSLTMYCVQKGRDSLSFFCTYISFLVFKCSTDGIFSFSSSSIYLKGLMKILQFLMTSIWITARSCSILLLEVSLLFSSYSVRILRVLYHHSVKQRQTQQLVTTTHSNMFVLLPKFNTRPVVLPFQGVHVSRSLRKQNFGEGRN